jgi:4-hydroxybenzoate polyprenyltransferase
MAQCLLVAVVVLSCLATFPLNGADAVWAFGFFLIAISWLVQWDEFTKKTPASESRMFWNLLLNLIMVIGIFLVLRYLVKLFVFG